METVEEELCVFCKKGISDNDNINRVSKGLKTIRDISIARGDDLYRVLENNQSVTVHEKCRKDYTRRGNINSVLCPIDNNQSIVTLRRSVDHFDFKHDCLFCGKVAQYENWKGPTGCRVSRQRTRYR